jgi:hypothetical protein
LKGLSASSSCASWLRFELIVLPQDRQRLAGQLGVVVDVDRLSKTAKVSNLFA